MKDVGIVIQARMGSSRLPGKVLMGIGSFTILDHILQRIQVIGFLQNTVIATSIKSQDDVISSNIYSHKVNNFRGSEDDVLSRYYACASWFGFKHVVRLTADNPFVDQEELLNLIGYHIAHGFDYTHSFGDMPVGVGAEVFSYTALRESYYRGKAKNHREHVNEYIHENCNKFKVGQLTVPNKKKAQDLRLTVDTADDLNRCRNLYSCCGELLPSTERLIECYA